ncbi:hypothetical protein JXA88_06490 [Candidatus Fermentibacteria bacterium]|nr:hypothetical protein [Candidatus Fermentibacteria bacterium]
MIPALLLAVLVVAALRPRWAHPALLIAAALVAAMQVHLLVSPEALWTGGLGILRGTRRGFETAFGDGAIGSWDSLGLLMALWILLVTARAASSSLMPVLGVTGFIGLVTLNGIGLLAAAWSLVVMACTLSGTPLRWRWSAAAASVLLAGVGMAALAVAGFPTMLHAPEGFGGALDGDGIGLIRHMLTGRLSGWQGNLVVALPLLLLLSAVCVAAGMSRDLAVVGAAAGPMLLLKLYPLMELALREGPLASVALQASGAALVAWAGFGRVSRPARQGFVCVGGAAALLGARLPVEGVAWAMAWSCVAAPGGRALLGPLVPAVAISGCALANYAAGDAGAFRFTVCLIMAVGVVVAAGTPARRSRWLTGFVACVALALVMIPPVASPFWQWWTGKLRPIVPGSLAPWMVVAAGYGAGFIMRRAAKDMLDRIQTRLMGIRARLAYHITAWTTPVVDTVAVLWVAAERFGWQGLTLWLPRRAAGFGAIAVAWFHLVVVPGVGRIPLHGVALIAWCAAQVTRTPGAVVLVIAAVLGLAWIF